MQPFGNVDRQFATQRVAVKGVVLYLHDALAAKVAAADIIAHLIVAALYRDVVLVLGACALVKIAVPVNIAIIFIGAIGLSNHPGARTVFFYIVAAHPQFGHVFVGILRVSARLITGSPEILGHAQPVVTFVYIVGRGGVFQPSHTAVIIDTCLGGNEDNTCRRFCAIDRSGRGIFQDAHAFNIVGV